MREPGSYDFLHSEQLQPTFRTTSYIPTVESGQIDKHKTKEKGHTPTPQPQYFRVVCLYARTLLHLTFLLPTASRNYYSDHLWQLFTKPLLFLPETWEGRKIFGFYNHEIIGIVASQVCTRTSVEDILPVGALIQPR